MAYPLFIPPEKFFSTKNFDWSLKDSKEYFNWFISTKSNRSNYYLEYLSIQRHEIDFDILCDRIRDTLFSEEFSLKTEGGVFDLTNAGYAFAADTSIVLSDYVIDKYKGKVYWDIVKKPKSDISFHLPALFGFKKLPYVELMKASIGHAKYILRKKEDPHVWKMMVDLDYLF
ncbi:hypothetical protein [Sphingobacterium tabacisoli]|uniref:Uncharacterized protein n=1 Tax=Sphingobacterium tabacisoli TaxID=2044855 RepID=A0ABW5L900_9SPHI|nr:hypothetical protein [Sphingobacterium tabacisoli]